MPFHDLTILSADLPDGLPTLEEIIALCRAKGYNISGTRVLSSSGLVCAWAKHGRNVTMEEARTQNAVAEMVNAVSGIAVLVPKVYLALEDGGFGYIVMEYIDGFDSSENESDIIKVAAAVEQLIGLHIPATNPHGPVGGGPITHCFFLEWRSAVTYGTVALLPEHINILKAMPVKDRVDFTGEIEEGLCLCPCDINPGNFRINETGAVVALDFGATCFLPSSFFVFAISQGHTFALKVARRVKYPASSNLGPMLRVSGYMVPFGRSDIYLPRALR